MSGEHEGHGHDDDSGAGALWDVLDGLVLAAVVCLGMLGAEWLIRQLAAERTARRTPVPDDARTLTEPR